MKVGIVGHHHQLPSIKYPSYGMKCIVCHEAKGGIGFLHKNPVVQQENYELWLVKYARPTLGMLKILKKIVEFSDIMHVYYIAHLSAGFASALTKIYKKPLVVTTFDSLIGRSFLRDGLKGPVYKMWPKISWKLADKIIAFTLKETKWLESLNIPSEKIEVMPWGINYSQCHSYYERYKSERCSKDYLEVLSVARISPAKNLHTLINSFHKVVSQSDIDIRLSNFGYVYDKNYYNKILSLIRKRKLNNRIKLNPTVPHKDLFKYYSRADIFILPSVIDQFAIVTLEAMVCELPVIISEKAGSSEIVKKHNCGIIIDPLNQKEIQNAILKLSESEGIRQKLGKRGAFAVKNYYTWDIMMKHIKMLYKKVLE